MKSSYLLLTSGTALLLAACATSPPAPTIGTASCPAHTGKTVQYGDRILFTGTVRMIKASGSHVRNVCISFPRLAQVIDHNAIPFSPAASAPLMYAYDKKPTLYADHTEYSIAGQTQDDPANPNCHLYFVRYNLLGKLAKVP